MNIPKIFWKYFDLYRRNLISLEEYEINTGIDKEQLIKFLKYVVEN